MCGIAGILRWKGVPQRPLEIERMTEAIKHRGPDGEGFFRQGGLAFGNRRLAIIDLEGGKQPMSSTHEQLWVTYNGEIYNFKDLRNELERKGYRFSTRSDTEVILHAYEEWGVQCVNRFRGMFAFGLADIRKRKLIIARDHFGIKPLYYRVGDGYVAFASELAALRQVDDVCPAGNLHAVELYLRFQYIPTPQTIYQAIYKLPPATYSVIGFNGDISQPTRYWQPEYLPERGYSDHEWEERANAVIHESVEAHLVSDVPFGVFLSGGVDSSLVAMKMTQILQRPVEAFSIGFDEEAYSELPYAEEAAKRCGVRLHTEVIKDDVLSILPDLVAHYGEPFGDSSMIPTWCVSRLARQRVPMVLSGDGGDEAFGGYDTYAQWMKEDPLLDVRRLARTWPRAALPAFFRVALKWLGAGSLNSLAEWQRHVLYLDLDCRKALWRPDYRWLTEIGCEVFERADRDGRRRDRLAYAQYLDYQTYLPCDILAKVDVASMYHGLEVRPPLVDVRVVDLAMHLPVSQRFRFHDDKEPVRKPVLKNILGTSFSPEFIHRKKQGFAIPRSEWFLPGRAARKLFEQVIMNPKSALREWFEPATIHAELASHRSDHDNSRTLWQLLILGLWVEQNRQVSFT